jgi:hypothetical protein
VLCHTWKIYCLGNFLKQNYDKGFLNFVSDSEGKVGGNVFGILIL